MREVYRVAIGVMMASLVCFGFGALSAEESGILVASHEPGVRPERDVGVTRVPGIDLSRLLEPQRAEIIKRLDSEQCTCGCRLSLLQCRIQDSTCPVSLKRAQEILAEVTRAQLPPSPPLSPERPKGELEEDDEEEAPRRPLSPEPPGGRPSAAVFVNGRPLTEGQVAELRALYGVVPPPGRYWYDPRSGLHGPWGREAVGFLRPGHNFGPVPPDASQGNTGIFVNGRHLNLIEALYFQQVFGAVYPGRWWLDGSTGNVGLEGNPIPIANLFLALQQAQQRGAGGGASYRWNSATGSGGIEGRCVWISGGPMSPGC